MKERAGNRPFFLSGVELKAGSRIPNLWFAHPIVQCKDASFDRKTLKRRLMLASIPRIAALIAAIFTAWMISGWGMSSVFFTRYDDARVLELVALIALLSAGMLARAYPTPPAEKSSRIALTAVSAFFAIGIVSAARSAYPAYGYLEIAILVSLILAAGLIRNIRTQAADDALRIHLLAVMAVGALVLGFRYLQDLLATVQTGDSRWVLLSWLPFPQPRFFAKAAGFALPLLWLLPRLPLRHAAALLIPSGFASVMISSELVGTGSRGALFGLLASIVIAALLLRKPGRSYALWQTGSLIAGTALCLGIERWSGLATSSRIITADSSGRDVLYAHLLDDLLSAPWLGIGPMQFSVFDRHPDIGIAGPHSLPLQLAAEWGLPALALVLVLAAWWFLNYLREIRGLGTQGQARRHEAQIDVALFMMLVIAGIHSLVANVLNDPVSQLAIVLVFGMTRPAVALASTRAAHSVVSTAASLVLAISCMLAIGWALRAGAPCYLKSSAAVRMTGPDGLIYPRIWTEGLIPLSRSCRVPAAGESSDVHSNTRINRPR